MIKDIPTNKLRQEGNHEDRRGREVTSNIWAQTTSGSLDSKMSSPLPARQTRSTWTRCHCSSREKVAGGGAREVLEEGREGSHSRLCPGMEILPVWICQAGLIVQKCFSAIIYSIIMSNIVCNICQNTNKRVNCQIVESCNPGLENMK